MEYMVRFNLTPAQEMVATERAAELGMSVQGALDDMVVKQVNGAVRQWVRERVELECAKLGNDDVLARLISGLKG